MRRTLSNAGRAGLILLMTSLAAAAAQPEPLPVVTILVDNAKVIRLPEKTSTVIVGNPIIAEVTPQKNGVLVLTGKSFGSTNLIALDNAGGMIAETTIRVEASRDSTITVQRGDSASYCGAASGQADARRKLATGGGGAVPAAEH